MRKIVLVSVFMLLFCLAAAMDVRPKMVGAAVVDANLSWFVDLDGQTSQELTLATYDFFSNAQQERLPLSSSPHSFRQDAWGNDLLAFSLDPSSSIHAISLISRVSADYSKGFDVATNVSAYLGESTYVVLSPELRSKALQVAGAGTDLEKATRIAEWVHNRVEYEGLGFYRDNLLTSKQVFEVRKGKCSEFSHLLIAMLRAVGIPARFVAGFVYSGEEWAAHAWTEAAIGGNWIPFDATYGEGIILDGTHLKFAHAVDQSEVREEISGKGYDLNLGLAKVSKSAKFSFFSSTPFNDLVSISLSAPNQTLGAGSIAVVTARVKAKRDMAVPLSITLPSIPIELKSADEVDRLVFMHAGEEREFVWTLIIPSNLAENYVYTFPITVSSLGVEQIGSISAKQGAPQTASSALAVSDLSYVISEGELKLLVSLRNKGSIALAAPTLFVSFLSSSRQLSFSLGVGEERQFELSFPVPAGNGKHEGEIRVVFEGGELKQPFALEFSKQLITPSVQPTVFVEPTGNASLPPAPTPFRPPLEVLGSDFRLMAGFGVAIILIVLALILIFRKRRGYSTV